MIGSNLNTGEEDPGILNQQKAPSINGETKTSFTVFDPIFNREVKRWGQTGVAGSLISPLNLKGLEIRVTPIDKIQNAEQQNQEIAEFINIHQPPGSWDGEYANVFVISTDPNNPNVFELVVGKTTSTQYLTSASANRDDQSKNPICPLAVQATLFTPDKKAIIIERKSLDPSVAQDNRGQLTEFGGAVNSTQATNLHEALRLRLEKKYGLVGITSDQILPTGLAADTRSKILCTMNSVEINEDQYSGLKNSAQKRDSTVLELSTDGDEIEKFFLQNGWDSWDPNGLLNIMYSLVYNGIRTESQVLELMSNMDSLAFLNMQKNGPPKYDYPKDFVLTHNPIDINTVVRAGIELDFDI